MINQCSQILVKRTNLFQNLVQKNKFNLCKPVFWRPPLSFIDILSSGAGYTIHSNMSARPALLVDAFPISDSRLCTKVAGENSFWVLCLKFTETRQRPAWPGMGLCGFGSGTFWENINLPLPQLSVLTCSFSWEKIYFGALNEYYICVQ